jgi:type IV pilus assembly protein PilB
MDKKHRRLGEILIDKGLITAEQLEDALKEQKRTKEFLGKILIKKKLIKEKDLMSVLSEQFSIPFVSIRYQYIDWNFVRKFSSALILEYKCFPLQEENNTVVIAITNPLDVWALKRIEEETMGFNFRLVLATEQDMQEAINRYKEYIRGKYI